MNTLKDSILQTLAYFDVIGYPTTKEELWRFLWSAPAANPTIMSEELANLVEARIVAERYGYYFLVGREELVEKRRQAVVPSEQKLKKATSSIRLIRSVPFLRAVFVCNSVGAETSALESDIDVFIVAERGRVWIVRLFTNVLLRLFGRRTYGKHQADRICLSFFVGDDHLDLGQYRAVPDDIHFAYWLYQMIPAYDPENIYVQMLEANAWVKQYLPNAFKSAELSRFATSTIKDGRIGKIWKKMWERMWAGTYGNLIERDAHKMQYEKMKFSLRDLSEKPDHGVVITDDVVKLHEHDTRVVIREEWLKKIGYLVR